MSNEYPNKKCLSKKVIVTISGTAILLIVCFLLFGPHKLIRDTDSIQYIRMKYYGRKIADENIDAEALSGILSSVWCRRIYGFPIYSATEDVVELDFIADGKPVHMIFGKYNYCYHSAGIYREYEILNSKKIYSEIVSSIPVTANKKLN